MDFMDKDLGKILKNNAQTLRHELLPQGTDCFRVYDRNLSRYPVTVDIYGKYAKVTDYGEVPLSDEDRETLLDICSRMLYLQKENVVYAVRNRRVEHEQHERTELEAVKTTVHENGLLFSVDLTTYVDTGLFLDHVRTRQLIRERSANADVLNLFSYTGSFSVYAASGLANSVTSVDMSATYTRWAEENLLANGYSGETYRCICMDAGRFVADALEKNLKYDIIIFDPPSFSNSRKMDGDFDVARDYAVWIRNLFGLLKKTGIILFSTNLGSFQMDKRKLRGLSIKEITGAFAAPGFVKGRAGTVRSWMMAFDDDSLSLDWSEPEKKSEKGSDSRQQTKGRSDDRGERKPYERKSYDRKTYDRKPSERRYSDRKQGDRYSSDRRRYDEDRPRSERSYDRSDRYERDERPRRSSYDKTYGSDRPYHDRPYQDRPYRQERRDRDDRSYARGRDDRPRYSEDRSYGERSYGDRSRGERGRGERSYGERSLDRERSFNRSDRPRSYGEKKDYQRRENTDNRKPSRKPYGYDSFKPARSREDSTDFFWNEEDLDPKKKD